jgi:hypothetical protein
MPRNSFGLEIFLQAENTIFAVVVGLLIFPEDRKGVPCWKVDVDLPGTNPGRQAARTIYIL